MYVAKFPVCSFYERERNDTFVFSRYNVSENSKKHIDIEFDRFSRRSIIVVKVKCMWQNFQELRF